MNIKFDLKERKKEIVIISIYLVVFMLCFLWISSIINLKNIEKDNVASAEKEYNYIKNSNFSETKLISELKKVTEELDKANNKLPYDLSSKSINVMLAEISQKNNNIFNLGRCNVSEVNRKGYTAYEVRITGIDGEYSQVKKLINYIEKYKVKIKITQLDLNKVGSNISGSMTLEFYGLESNKEGV